MTATTSPIRLGVLIGGGGRTLINLADWIERGDLAATIETVIAHRDDLPGVERARQRNLPVAVIRNAKARRGGRASLPAAGQDARPTRDTAGQDARPTPGTKARSGGTIHPLTRTHLRTHTPATLDDDITTHLLEHEIDLVCLGGYLRHLHIDDRFAGRIMNIHPALLPSFGGKGMFGLRVHEAVLQHGCKVSGCTVHFVDEEYDHGPIILQKACRVLEDDTPQTLADRVFELECRAYPEAISLFAEGRLSIEGRRVRISPALSPAGWNHR